MRKGTFQKELERHQEYFINCLISQGIPAKEKFFYITHFQVPVLASDEEYSQMLHDPDMKMNLQNASSMTGLSLSLDRVYIALNVTFPFKGFFCYRKYYGKFLDKLERRLQFEFGNKLRIDAHGELSRTNYAVNIRKKFDSEIEQDLQKEKQL